jgi:hypothetical protein
MRVEWYACTTLAGKHLQVNAWCGWNGGSVMQLLRYAFVIGLKHVVCLRPCGTARYAGGKLSCCMTLVLYT